MYVFVYVCVCRRLVLPLFCIAAHFPRRPSCGTVCMHECMYLCMYVCVGGLFCHFSASPLTSPEGLRVALYVCMNVCMHECMYVCGKICIYIQSYHCITADFPGETACGAVCVHECLCVCMYVHTYINTYMYTFQE